MYNTIFHFITDLNLTNYTEKEVETPNRKHGNIPL